MKTIETDAQRQELFEQYQNEMAGRFGFGDPQKWRNGPRNFAAYLASRKIASDFNTGLGIIIKTCAEHPAADVRHEYDETHAVLNKLPSGEGVKSNHSFKCSVCLKELEQKPEQP